MNRIVLLNSYGQLIKVVEGEREISVSALDNEKYYRLFVDNGVKRASFVKQ